MIALLPNIESASWKITAYCYYVYRAEKLLKYAAIVSARLSLTKHISLSDAWKVRRNLGSLEDSGVLSVNGKNKSDQK